MLTVKLYSVRVNHGGFDCHCTLVYPGKRIKSLSRTFTCECGEPMHDGDPYDSELYDKTGRIVHTNCTGRK